ncbi:transcription antitermination factor NusB [Saccharobesus litoralis]|uniref:Transcription antitermination protein NusB n=1 Tax=Saccharobesus litoralis TaxID=2172099 RepID=A0A2S0VL98_9ALTE|nr:transcription antitermination factor NusB [Saccharobesus litoralis]AWB64977.1 transcription antitermination factor NusB [Saccharobesus litoralis]
MKGSQRRKARQLAAQAIYSWQVTNNRIADVIEAMEEENDVNEFDVVYFKKLVNGVAMTADNLDIAYKPHLARDIAEVDLVEKAILRVATYELSDCKEVPYKVVINEAIEVAKVFAADDSHKFINGVLDKAVKFIRKSEFKK